MRILQVHTRYRQQGGEDAVVEAERLLLQSAGHQVDLYEASNSDSAYGGALQFIAAPWNLASARRAREAVAQSEPAVVHIHNTWFAMSPSVVRSVANGGLPVVMTLHNYRVACINAELLRNGAPCEVCVGSSPWQGVRSRCYRGSLPQSFVAGLTRAVQQASGSWDRVDRFLALTPFARSIYIRAGLDADRIEVKPNFIEDPGPRPHAPSQDDRVLFVGRLTEAKGISFLLAAWKEAEVGGLRLQVVGDGPLKSELVDRYPKVEFLGWRDKSEIRDMMLTARALVFPSLWYEGQSMVLLEAMSAGLPVLASDWGPIRNTLTSLDHHWLMPAGKLDRWTSGLSSLGMDSTVDIASAQVRKDYDAAHTPEVALANLEVVYSAAIKHHS